MCEGVITMPSARARPAPVLCTRMALDTAGVGVYPPRASSSTRTSFAASTSRALTWAGSDSACVSAPRYSGPSMPSLARYSQIAWVAARM